MIHERLEYLLLIIIAFSAIAPLFFEKISELWRRRDYRFSLSLFVAFCFVLEEFALSRNWWEFSSERLIGLYIHLVPIEEIILFVAWHMIAVSAWEIFER